MPRTALAAVAAATLLAVLGFAPVASADPGDIGFKGPTFKGYTAGSGVPPTVSKPESKLWFNDGLWWAVMFDTVSRTFHIFKLNTGTHAWADTGTVVDDRNGTVADVLWDGSKLYVASHVYAQDSAGATNQSRLYRFSYNAGSDTYTLDGGFPAQINSTSSESLVIDKDSTGQLWATWTQGSPKVVMVNSTQGSDSSWGTPFQVSTNTITADGISSLVAFGGNRIGVMWGDQDAADRAYYFAIHNDADPDGAWSTPESALGPATCPTTQNCADDHVNLKADSAGRVFAAVKTSLTGTLPTNYLLVRTPSGAWVKHLYGTADQQHTRAIVVLDMTNGLARMFATVTEAGGTIYEKTLPLSQADTDGSNFPVGLGAPRLVAEDAQGAVLNMNNATSTKQSVSAVSGLVVLATNKKTSVTPDIEDYWHHEGSLVGTDVTAPVLQTASVTGSKITLVYNEVLDVSSVPNTTAFAVTVGGAARTVTTVTVSTNAVILRTLSPVIAGEVVSLSYTAPATGPIQDISGNDAGNLTNRAVTNATSAGTTFDLIPTGDGTRSGVTTGTGATTSLFAAIDDGIATPDDGGTFIQNGATGTGGGQAGHIFLQLTDMPSNFTAMSSMTIDVRARTQNRIDDNTTLFARLFKADEVTPLSNEVQVAVNPGLSNWVTISGVAFTGLVAGTKADWDGARVKLRWLPTAVGTPDSQNRLRVTAAELHATHGTGPIDTTPPVFQSAAVNGASLTLTYNETLDAASIPAATAFAVAVGGAARGVSNVAIAGSTVTLTLASAVTAGQAVTVAYTKPATNPIQDAAGNDAVNLAATSVTNNTGGGGTTFDLRPNGDGTRDPAIKTQSGGTTSLFAAIDEGVATPDDATTYVRNDNGQSGRYFAQLTDTPANFGSMTSLRLDGRVRTVGRVDDNLTLFAQAMRSNGTALSSEVAVGTANPGSSGWTTISNVNLTGIVAGTKADWDGAQLRLRWANIAGGRTADAIQLQLTAVDLHATYSTGGGGDVTPPVFQSASVNGSTLTMTYNEALDAASTPAASAFAVTVNGAARGVSSVTVTGSTARLTLVSPVVAGNTITVAYTKPATNPLQDAAGNDAVNLAATNVTNTTPGGGGDVTPPVFVSASVVSSTLTMNYNEVLDPGSRPAAGAFAVTVNGVARPVTGVAISGTRALLTLQSPVALRQTVLVSYTAPATGPLQDAAGNDAASIANKPVSNIGR